MRTSTPAPPSLDRRAFAFLGATCVSVIGTAFGMLGATAATSAAGGPGGSGITTGLFTATLFAGTALAIPYGPVVAGRLGCRRAFRLSQAVSALAFLAAGGLLLVGTPPMPVLLLAATLIGLCSGVASVLRTLVSKAYQSSNNTAHSFARLSTALGIAAVVGGLAGGFTLSRIAFGWGLVVDAILTIPLVVVLGRVVPTTEPATPSSPRHPWRTALVRLTSNRRLRWSAALGGSTMLLLAPTIALVVPIAEALRQVPAVGAAGVLMASFAIGEVASPLSVRFAQRRADDLRSGQVAGALAGASLILLGAVSAILSQRLELVVWVMIGVAFGLFRFAGRALYIGSVADAGSDPATNLASANLVVFTTAPLGALVLGLSLDHGLVYVPLIASGALAIVWNLISMRLARDGQGSVGRPA